MNKKEIDILEGEIMNWFYEVVKINFGVEMIQDATELREILDNFLFPPKKR